jgi:hypothetical protein
MTMHAIYLWIRKILRLKTEQEKADEKLQQVKKDIANSSRSVSEWLHDDWGRDRY